MRSFKIACPKCGKRIFDVLKGASGIVSVKCPRCKVFSILDLLAACLRQSDESNQGR